MYDYLDRPVVTLGPADRLLLGAMRQWVALVRAQRCPCAVLGPALNAHGAGMVLHDLNMAMLLLDRDGMEQLHFKPLGCGALSDDEAMLLSVCAAARVGEHATVAGVVAQIVKPDARHALGVAIERIVAMLPH